MYSRGSPSDAQGAPTMVLNRQLLLEWKVDDIVQTYTERDTLLYSLSLGLGMNPIDPAELSYVLEPAPKVFPTMALVLGNPGPWTGHPVLGIDRKMIVHGEQGITWHRGLPTSGTVIGQTRVLDVIDKGAEKGALLFTERKLYLAESNELIASITGTTVCRGNGGFGGPSGPVPSPHKLPNRAPDLAVDMSTTPQAALLYRLNGDYNTLHADPVRARQAGFPRPISHGLFSFGLCARAVVQSHCGMDGTRLKAFSGRFASPAYPGETLRIQLWRDDDVVSFNAIEPLRNVQVVSNGRAQIT